MLARVIGLSRDAATTSKALRSRRPSTRGTSRASPSSPRGTPMVLEQIKHQLERMVPIHWVIDLTATPASLERELALVKVAGKGEPRVEALRLAERFARCIDATTENFVFEITGRTPNRTVYRDDDAARPGRGVAYRLAAIARGAEGNVTMLARDWVLQRSPSGRGRFCDRKTRRRATTRSSAMRLNARGRRSCALASRQAGGSPISAAAPAF